MSMTNQSSTRLRYSIKYFHKQNTKLIMESQKQNAWLDRNGGTSKMIDYRFVGCEIKNNAGPVINN